MIKNLTGSVKQNQSEKYTDLNNWKNGQPRTKPSLSDNLFCPGNECIARKVDRNIDWATEEEKKIREILRKQNN